MNINDSMPLPRELFVRVFSHLDLRSLGRSSQVDKYWHQTIHSEVCRDLWQKCIDPRLFTAVKTEYPLLLEPLELTKLCGRIINSDPEIVECIGKFVRQISLQSHSKFNCIINTEGKQQKITIMVSEVSNESMNVSGYAKPPSIVYLYPNRKSQTITSYPDENCELNFEKSLTRGQDKHLHSFNKYQQTLILTHKLVVDKNFLLVSIQINEDLSNNFDPGNSNKKCLIQLVQNMIVDKFNTLLDEHYHTPVNLLARLKRSIALSNSPVLRIFNCIRFIMLN